MGEPVEQRTGEPLGTERWSIRRTARFKVTDHNRARGERQLFFYKKLGSFCQFANKCTEPKACQRGYQRP